MKKLPIIATILAVSAVAQAGWTPSAPQATVHGLSNSTCSYDAHWASSNAGGVCEMTPGLGQRKLVVNDFADSASDTITITQCAAGGSCNTDTLTASATAVYATSVVIVDYTKCATDTITVTTVDQNGVSLATVLTEPTHWNDATSNNAVAASLCAGVNSYVPGVSGTASTATCILSKQSTYQSVTVASGDATCATVTNTTDTTFSCNASNANCASKIKHKLDGLLTAGTVEGFTTVLSGATVGFVPSATTTVLDVEVTNSANDALGVVTSGADGTVIVRNPAILLNSFRTCGNGPNATTAVYTRPLIPSDMATDYTYGSAGCDALDNTTEATADAPLHAAIAVKPVAMLCATDGGTDDTVSFSLRSAAAAADADLACDIVVSGSAKQCFVYDPSPTTIAAGATFAVKVVADTDDDMSSDDFECTVWFTY